ncbi:MAG TPA: winged helix-turn-helix domain-containing protein [Gaiellaceae bacterium]|nr:winged helix-turn-helix domain-containing protein [Gaiellaceae bacterium]
MARHTLLLIEDEESIAEPLHLALEREGFEVVWAATAAAGLEAFRSRSPEVVLLDVMLPDGDGRDVLRELRSSSTVPVVMLTARGEEIDRVLGLELGADDYVTKPFSVAELVARLRAVLRRASAPVSEPDVNLEVGDVSLSRETRMVSRSGQAIELTVKEFDLLAMLLENAGRVVRRGDLMREVWDTSWLGSTKTLDVHVSALRKKLGDDPGDPRYIHTVRGVGFRFASVDELAGQALRLQADGAANVWADPADVAHILDNLIENAVRYSPAGSDIVVDASSGVAGTSLTVSDTGPGIPAEDRDRVFDRFYRGANGRSSSPGTGLGLAIVAELVERWNGHVRLVEGPGTSIEASFPPPTFP